MDPLVQNKKYRNCSLVLKTCYVLLFQNSNMRAKKSQILINQSEQTSRFSIHVSISILCITFLLRALCMLV